MGTNEGWTVWTNSVQMNVAIEQMMKQVTASDGVTPLQQGTWHDDAPIEMHVPNGTYKKGKASNSKS